MMSDRSDRVRDRLRKLREKAAAPIGAPAEPHELERDELFDYPRKSLPVAFIAWLTLGLVGGHRFYLNRPGTAVVMMLTGGGLFAWWVVDLFHLRAMVREYNGEHETRRREGRPPLGFEFLSSLHPKQLGGRPAWADRRKGGPTELLGDAVVVFMAGLFAGSATVATGAWEALVAIVALAVLLNAPEQLRALRHIPVVDDLVRWELRLRLYYHARDPGGAVSRLLRPVTGIFALLFRGRGRAEARLYLELGGVLAILLGLVDVVQDVAVPWLAQGRTGDLPGLWMASFAQNLVVSLVTVYAFVTPIGATLTKCVLTRRSRGIGWVLTALTIGGVAVGLLRAG